MQLLSAVAGGEKAEAAMSLSPINFSSETRLLPVRPSIFSAATSVPSSLSMNELHIIITSAFTEMLVGVPRKLIAQVLIVECVFVNNIGFRKI